MDKLTRIICILLVTLLSSPLHAASWYQVELIIFEYLYPDTAGERWDANADLPVLERTVEIVSGKEDTPVFEGSGTAGNAAISGTEADAGTSGSGLGPYQKLPVERYRLEGIFRALKLSREYRPVYHVSWQQPGLDSNAARAVHVQAADRATVDEDVLPREWDPDTVPGEFYQPVQLLFDGTIRIRSSLYLHADIEMVYFKRPEPSEPAPLASVGPPEDGLSEMETDKSNIDYVRIRESRRLKLNELHYFDHPLFGVIMQVSRL